MSVKEFINKDSNINLVFISGGPGLSSISFNRLMSLKEEILTAFH